jgi:hypothetical protein
MLLGKNDKMGFKQEDLNKKDETTSLRHEIDEAEEISMKLR